MLPLESLEIARSTPMIFFGCFVLETKTLKNSKLSEIRKTWKMVKTGDSGRLKIDKETKPISNVHYQIIPLRAQYEANPLSLSEWDFYLRVRTVENLVISIFSCSSKSLSFLIGLNWKFLKIDQNVFDPWPEWMLRPIKSDQIRFGYSCFWTFVGPTVASSSSLEF